jgi:hypothetical protein
MTEPWVDSSDEQPAIAKIEASPQSGEGGVYARQEASRFRRFWEWLFPRLERGADLSEAYGRAGVAEKDASARRIAEEAAEIAAKRELAEAQAATQRQAEVKQFIENIEAIEGLQTTAGRKLAFAKVLEKNPDMVAQVEIVEQIVDRLSIQRGLMITSVINEQAVMKSSDEIAE